jgi:hypothetical protein
MICVSTNYLDETADRLWEVVARPMTAPAIHANEIPRVYSGDQSSVFQINAVLSTTNFQKSKFNYINDLALI